MTFRKTWISACLSVLLAGPVAAAAAQDLTEQQSRKDDRYIVDLAERSDLVVVGEVMKNEPQWYKKSIVTLSAVRPISFLKGEPGWETIPVLFFGGTVGVINQEFTHTATLREGEVVVLFLYRPEDGVSQEFRNFRILGEEGKILLLRPGQPKTRLENNERLGRFLNNLAALVREGRGEQ